MGRPNASRETEFYKNVFSVQLDHEQDWQPYPVDPYSVICDGHTSSLEDIHI